MGGAFVYVCPFVGVHMLGLCLRTFFDHNTEPRVLPYKLAAIVHVPSNDVCLTPQKSRFPILCIKAPPYRLVWGPPLKGDYGYRSPVKAKKS